MNAYSNNSYKSQGKTVNQVLIDGDMFKKYEPVDPTEVRIMDTLSVMLEHNVSWDLDKMEDLYKSLRQTTGEIDVTIAVTDADTGEMKYVKYDQVGKQRPVVDESLGLPNPEGTLTFCMEHNPEEFLNKLMAIREERERRHPIIFKITDLVGDKSYEMARVEKHSRQQYQFERKVPFFIAADGVQELGMSTEEVAALWEEGGVLHRIRELAKEQNLPFLIGPRHQLKLMAYGYLYGQPLNEGIVGTDVVMHYDVEEPEEKPQRVAIIGGGARIGKSLMNEIIRNISSTASLWEQDACNLFAKELQWERKISQPKCDWSQTKLRRGKGHNKFSKKGKK